MRGVFGCSYIEVYVESFSRRYGGRVTISILMVVSGAVLCEVGAFGRLSILPDV